MYDNQIIQQPLIKCSSNKPVDGAQSIIFPAAILYSMSTKSDDIQTSLPMFSEKGRQE